jgi:hypothetical protein
MMTELLVRDYRDSDAKAVVEIFRDASGTLRKSRGGMHRDDEIDTVLALPDDQLIARLTDRSHLLVAEIPETGELVGMGAIRAGGVHRLIGSAFSLNHYVPERLQKGRGGMNVGSVLRKETIARAKELGYRKLFGYAVPESEGFHAKFGADFLPKYNIRDRHNGIEYKYYEFELRRSALNAIRLECYAARFVKLYRDLKRTGRKTLLPRSGHRMS